MIFKIHCQFKYKNNYTFEIFMVLSIAPYNKLDIKGEYNIRLQLIKLVFSNTVLIRLTFCKWP